MNIEFVTKEDLTVFRQQLLSDIKGLLSIAKADLKHPEWLRGFEVKKILKISTGTLQNLRIKGSLHPNKIGGILYYSMAEITTLLSGKA